MMKDWIDGRSRAWAVVAVVAGLALYLGLEIREEPDMSAFDVALTLVEILPLVLTSVGVALLFTIARRRHEEQLTLIHDLELARAQGQRWRAEARTLLDGLGEAMEAQFSRWNFTDAEREVALLLLKGLSLKEIAAVRNTSERTVRAQARSVSGTAGLTGRAALAAFFLEDLLAPIEGLK